MSQKKELSSLEGYLEQVPADVRDHPRRDHRDHTAYRAVSRGIDQLPDAAFKRARIFVFVGAFKHHIGMYPPVHGSDALEEALLPYRGPKGNLRFPLDQPMPYNLIERVG